MLAKSEGMFLWIRVLEGDLSGAKNKRALFRVVEQAPTALDRLYDNNWNRITSGRAEKKAFSILRWVAFASRPLTVLELAEALTIPEDDADDLDDDDLPDNIDELYIWEGIVGLCESLVEVRSQEQPTELDAGFSTVHIVHFSVRQYLINRLPVSDGLRPSDIRLANRHVAHERYLTIQCLRYLGMGRAFEEGLRLGDAIVPRVFIRIAVGAFNPCPRRPDSAVMHPTIAGMINKLIDPRRTTWSSLRPRIMSTKSSPQNLACHALFVACYAGFEPAEYMLSQVKTPATAADEDGLTALHFVSDECAGAEAKIKLLIDYGAEVNAQCKKGTSPLMRAAGRGRLSVVKLLLEHGACQNVDLYGATPLHYAASSGNVHILQLLIDHHADINAADNDSMTPLHMACRETKEDAVALLLANGADIESKDNDGFTPLMTAVLSGKLAVVELLLSHNSKIDSEDNRGLRPTHLAVKRASDGLDVLKLLSNQGADLNSKSNDHVTPLHTAAMMGRLACLEFLLDRGVDLERTTNEARTAAHFAADEGYIDCLKLLLERGADATANDGKSLMPIHYASMSGHVDCLKLLLEHGADVAARDSNCWTALHICSLWGSAECLMVLIKAGADVNARDKDGDQQGLTALMHAACFDEHTECLEALLSRSADVAATDVSGQTALHKAALMSHPNHLSLLLERGINVDASDNNGVTALHAAAEGKVENLKTLLAHGANTGARDTNGWSALHNASEYGQEECLSVLLGHEADINARSNNGTTALHIAAYGGQVAIIEILLDHGANIEARDDWDDTPLHNACQRGQAGSLSVLLRRGADGKTKNKNGGTAFHIACGTGDTKCLKVLIAGGLDFETVSVPHNSLAHLATIWGHLGSLELLLESGADPARLDSEGRSILHWCVRTGSEVGMDLVLKRGGGLDALQRDTYGLSVLAMAIVGGHESIAKRLLATIQGQFDFEDSLGRSLLWWARRNGSHDLADFLRREAAHRGVHLIEPAVHLGHGEGGPRLGSPLAPGSCGFCDVCTFNVAARQVRYGCFTCLGGYFLMCQECFDLRALCQPYHVLYQRTDPAAPEIAGSPDEGEKVEDAENEGSAV
ncbi:hypothetical protein RB595_003125 [Gaeumannomyces hyphopodioides]